MPTANSLHEQLCHVLANIQELNRRSSKHQQIRITHWVRKLLEQPISNPTWLRNVLEYANVLMHMLNDDVRCCINASLYALSHLLT